MSWFSEKVGSLVRDAQRQATAVSAPAAQRSVDELASELDLQVRRINGPQNATEVLFKWVDRCDKGDGAFSLGVPGEAGHGLAEPLSFYQALLRSQALETLVEACGRNPALRGELLRTGRSDKDRASMSFAMRLVAERVLLPGALALWPNLLEILLLTGASDDLEKGVPSMPPMCGPWARRALNLIKRQWQSETLPAALRCLDRKLAVLIQKREPLDDGDAQTDMMRQGARMSKTGIRAALARDKLKRHGVESARLRARAELLCDACARLEAAESSGFSSVPEAEQLLDDSDELIVKLDTGVKDLNSEQEQLKSALTETSTAIEGQMSEFRETLSSFTEKRAQFADERAALMRRLEEVNMQITKMDEAMSACDKEVRQLNVKLRDSTNHYEDKIAGSFQKQKRMADEKIRAISCKECAHMAMDVIKTEEQRRSADVKVQLRRRRAELRRCCAIYLREERLRLEAAAESSEGAVPPPANHPSQASSGGPPRGGEADAPLAIVQDAWRASQAVLRRVLPLLRNEDAGSVAARSSVDVRPVAAAVTDSVQEAPPEDAQAFFIREAERGQSCIDCELPDADWATVSYGTYLCMTCAGKHRGLGVHLSFVRSTTMDVWSKDQLRRMQLGGTERFRQFLNTYPRLRDTPSTPTTLSMRYSSRAAAYYRMLLDARAEGSDRAAIDAPTPNEGHLPVDESGENQGSSSSASATTVADPYGDDYELAIGALEEESGELEDAYRQHQERHGLPFTAMNLSVAKQTYQPPVSESMKPSGSPVKSAVVGPNALAERAEAHREPSAVVEIAAPSTASTAAAAAEEGLSAGVATSTLIAPTTSTDAPNAVEQTPGADVAAQDVPASLDQTAADVTAPGLFAGLAVAASDDVSHMASEERTWELPEEPISEQTSSGYPVATAVMSSVGGNAPAVEPEPNSALTEAAEDVFS